MAAVSLPALNLLIFHSMGITGTQQISCPFRLWAWVILFSNTSKAYAVICSKQIVNSPSATERMMWHLERQVCRYRHRNRHLQKAGRRQAKESTKTRSRSSFLRTNWTQSQLPAQKEVKIQYLLSLLPVFLMFSPYLPQWEIEYLFFLLPYWGKSRFNPPLLPLGLMSEWLTWCHSKKDRKAAMCLPKRSREVAIRPMRPR